MLRRIISFLFAALLVSGLAPAANLSSAAAPAAAATVIGSGTAASCLTEAARNALSDAVAAGGTITFDCGPDPVIMPVNTNVTNQTVVVDGGNRVTLSGENLRQIFFVYGNGDLTLRNIALIDGAGFDGAALSVSDSTAKATIQNSFLTSNDAGSQFGGAIFNQGTLTIEHSTVGSNITTQYGGGIFNNGVALTIVDSTLISNQAGDGGAIFHVGGSLLIERSAIRSNIATNYGGGLHIDVGTAAVANSTFYDNRAAGGGGIYMNGDQLTITNATFNRNRADIGGALWNVSNQTTVQNTILAHSRTTNDTADSLNCDGPSLTSLGRNIVSDNTCVPNPSTVGDLLSTDPKLQPFHADNGGPTRNFMLLPDSPAIDYGLDCPDTDQRGYSRPIGPACDVGAVEYGWLVFLPAIRR
ncbi:MAG: choice-of-anchor Q domain-containing protein [Anaerolineae bacterium]|jgi:hypothetical protein